MRTSFLIILVVLLTVFSGLVSAQERYVAVLAPVPGTGSTGSGSATLVLDAPGTSLSYTISFSGLSSPEVAAHIHRPAGGVAFGLNPGSPKSGVWQFPSPQDLDFLRTGGLYILIHSDLHPMGELRGDIMNEQVLVEVTTWGAIKALYR